MDRLQIALDDLNRKGYTFTSLKRLSGGINSAVFQVKTIDKSKYVLKLYPMPSINDPRNRCLTEKNFWTTLILVSFAINPYF